MNKEAGQENGALEALKGILKKTQINPEFARALMGNHKQRNAALREYSGRIEPVYLALILAERYENENVDELEDWLTKIIAMKEEDEVQKRTEVAQATQQKRGWRNSGAPWYQNN